jgi:hypothetical protein
MALLLGIPCPLCAHRLTLRSRIQGGLLRIGIVCTYILTHSDDSLLSPKAVELPLVRKNDDALLCFAICENCFLSVVRRWPNNREFSP